MAPAAADTICQHFTDFGTTPQDYDRIVTGDLGVVGREILLDLVQKGDLTLRTCTRTAVLRFMRPKSREPGRGAPAAAVRP